MSYMFLGFHIIHICKILFRFNSKLSEWKEVRNRIKYLKDMTKRVLNLTKMKKSQGTIEKFTNSFMLFKGKVVMYSTTCLKYLVM